MGADAEASCLINPDILKINQINEPALQDLRASALRLQQEFEALTSLDSILKRAYEILMPLVELTLQEREGELPDEIPSHRFFYGMQEDCLPAHHLVDQVNLLNAIGEFDTSMRLLKTGKKYPWS